MQEKAEIPNHSSYRTPQASRFLLQGPAAQSVVGPFEAEREELHHPPWGLRTKGEEERAPKSNERQLGQYAAALLPQLDKRIAFRMGA